MSEKENNILFGGRLAEYRYYDMHQIIGSALQKSKNI
jgi:UDP-galactopyranose mutase